MTTVNNLYPDKMPRVINMKKMFGRMLGKEGDRERERETSSTVFPVNWKVSNITCNTVRAEGYSLNHWKPGPESPPLRSGQNVSYPSKYRLSNAESVNSIGSNSL